MVGEEERMFFWYAFLLFFFLLVVWGRYYDRRGRSAAREAVMDKKLPPLPWPFGLHVAG